MGLIVDVFRCSLGDCTNNGVSSEARSLVVVNIPGPFEPDERYPAVMLTTGPYETKRLVPAIQDSTGKWVPYRPDGLVGPSMGGNYAATSDSRFGRAVGFYGAVAIHDRFETPRR